MYPEVSLFLKKISNLNCTMLIKLTVTEFAKASWQARNDTFPVASHFQGGGNFPDSKPPSFTYFYSGETWENTSQLLCY